MTQSQRIAYCVAMIVVFLLSVWITEFSDRFRAIGRLQARGYWQSRLPRALWEVIAVESAVVVGLSPANEILPKLVWKKRDHNSRTWIVYATVSGRVNKHRRRIILGCTRYGSPAALPTDLIEAEDRGGGWYSCSGDGVTLVLRAGYMAFSRDLDVIERLLDAPPLHDSQSSLDPVASARE